MEATSAVIVYWMTYVIDKDMCSRIYWLQVQILLTNHFWKRWLYEYLPSLPSLKWRTNEFKVNIDNLALMKEHDIIRGHWPWIRFVAAHPEQDGIIRVVTVRILRGTYKRPVIEILLLESDAIEMPLDAGNAG